METPKVETPKVETPKVELLHVELPPQHCAFLFNFLETNPIAGSMPRQFARECQGVLSKVHQEWQAKQPKVETPKEEEEPKK